MNDDFTHSIRNLQPVESTLDLTSNEYYKRINIEIDAETRYEVKHATVRIIYGVTELAGVGQGVFYDF